MDTEFSKFQFSYRVGVADINYGGHVANSAVLNFFQDARIDYLANLGSYSEIDLGGCGIIMPEAHVFFRKEMFLGDELQIGVKSRDLKRSSWVMEYRIERDAELTAVGETPLICFNYQSRKPCRMPAEFRAALSDFERLSS
ncbi:MAG: thioesterase family protein [Thermodesulfobacteriota bacterium]|nr:thioesterase family protein [Thermodesulfobacteriota bacterium]